MDKKKLWLEYLEQKNHEYIRLLESLDLAPDKQIHLTCPGCSLESLVILPKKCFSSPDFSITCPCGCGYYDSFAEFKPRLVALQESDNFKNMNVCHSCSVYYFVKGRVSNRPCCGIPNFRDIIASSVHVDLAKFNALAIADKRVFLEKELEYIISIFDGVMRSMNKFHIQNNLVLGVNGPPPIRSFQSVDKASSTLRNAGFPIDCFVDDWEKFSFLFQVRHLVVHSLGVIDEGFAVKTKTPPSKIGELVEIDIADILFMTKSCVDIVVDYYGYYLS